MNIIYYDRERTARAIAELVLQSDGHTQLADILCEAATSFDKQGGPYPHTLERIAKLLTAAEENCDG